MDGIVKHDQLKAIAAIGGVRSVTIIAGPDGFVIRVSTSAGDQVLHSRYNQPRAFKKAETVLDYLKNDIGLARATIEFEHWTPKQRALTAAQ